MKTKFATHNNRFHTDDVFATATLFLLLKKEVNEVEIFRTRDVELINSADYVYDVGGVYDPEKNRFDHHQKGTAGARDNGITYSSFGLVWKKFGEQVCGSKEIAEMLDKKLVQPVDALDNGIQIGCENLEYGVRHYIINDVITAFDPSWPEPQNFDELFLQAVKMAKWILEREIIKAQDIEKARVILDKIYQETEDKRIIVLDNNYPWEDVLNKYPEPIFVVKQRGKNIWSVKAVRDDVYLFENRKNFPENWAGKTGEELAQITDVEDAVFCHNKRFICSAKSKEGAIKLAQLALRD